MSDEFADYLTPAEVASLLGIPPSTLRTYATAFGTLLSRGAQGDPAVAGRAFRHRRYTRGDLQVLSRAKALVDDGLSYRVALAQLSDGRTVVGDRRRPRLARPRATRPRGRKPESSGGVAPAMPLPISDPVPPPRSSEEPRIETRVEVVVDQAATEAIERLRGVVERVVRRIEGVDRRLMSLEGRLEALQADLWRLDRVDPPPPTPQKHWFRRLVDRGG